MSDSDFLKTEAMEAIECPQCGAAPGEFCQAGVMNPEHVHEARVREYVLG